MCEVYRNVSRKGCVLGSESEINAINVWVLIERSPVQQVESKGGGEGLTLCECFSWD